MLNGNFSLAPQIQAMREYFGDAAVRELVRRFFVSTVITSTDRAARRFALTEQQLGVPFVCTLNKKGQVMDGSTMYSSRRWGEMSISNFAVPLYSDPPETH